MSGQRTPPSGSQSPPDPPPTTHPRNNLPSRWSHRESRQPAESSSTPLPTSSSLQSLNPVSPVQTLPGAPRPSTEHKESRHSSTKATTRLPSPTTSSSTITPKQEHKPKSRSSTSNTTTKPRPNPTPTIQLPTSTAPPLVGAHLLPHPLHQLSLLLSLALSPPSASQAQAQATAHFTRPHITSTIRSITSLYSSLNDLNVDLASSLLPTPPSSEQEWLDIAWSLVARIEAGTDPSSAILRVAGEIVKLDTERSWRSWWYWGEVRRAEKRKEREGKEKDSKQEKRNEDKSAEHGEGMEALTLDIQGTSLPGITKFWRDMSPSEKDAAEQEFYLALRAQLQKLPRAESVASGEDMKQMARAIETMEEIRAQEEAEWEKRERKNEESKREGGGTERGDETEKMERRTAGKTAPQISRVRRDEEKVKQRQTQKQKSGSLADRTRVELRRSKAEAEPPGLSRGDSGVRDMDGDRKGLGTGAMDGNRERRREVAY